MPKQEAPPPAHLGWSAPRTHAGQQGRTHARAHARTLTSPRMLFLPRLQHFRRALPSPLLLLRSPSPRVQPRPLSPSGSRSYFISATCCTSQLLIPAHPLPRRPSSPSWSLSTKLLAFCQLTRRHISTDAMEKVNTTERLAGLRELMKKHEIDIYSKDTHSKIMCRVQNEKI